MGMHARLSPFLMPARAPTVLRCVSWWGCAYVGLRLVGTIAGYVFGGIGVWRCGESIGGFVWRQGFCNAFYLDIVIKC